MKKIQNKSIHGKFFWRSIGRKRRQRMKTYTAKELWYRRNILLLQCIACKKEFNFPKQEIGKNPITCILYNITCICWHLWWFLYWYSRKDSIGSAIVGFPEPGPLKPKCGPCGTCGGRGGPASNCRNFKGKDVKTYKC